MIDLSQAQLQQYYKITIPKKDGEQQVVSLNNLLYLMADSNYTLLTYKGEFGYHTSTVCSCLDVYDKDFNTICFMRFHRSYLVNLNLVIAINYKTHSLTMQNNEVIYFSKSHTEQLHLLFK
jgi:DNA-binding LytR/AlgR family response regulator